MSPKCGGSSTVVPTAIAKTTSTPPPWGCTATIFAPSPLNYCTTISMLASSSLADVSHFLASLLLDRSQLLYYSIVSRMFPGRNVIASLKKQTKTQHPRKMCSGLSPQQEIFGEHVGGEFVSIYPFIRNTSRSGNQACPSGHKTPPSHHKAESPQGFCVTGRAGILQEG